MRYLILRLCLIALPFLGTAQKIAPNFKYFDYDQEEMLFAAYWGNPNFQIEDYDSIRWELYKQLDSGKVVYFFVMSELDEVWAYHNTHILQDFYAAYGPQGSNTAMVMGLTAMDWGMVNGTETDAIGNWVSGTDYPIFMNYASTLGLPDLETGANYTGMLSTMMGLQTIGELSKVYRVCPDRTIIRYDSFPSYDELVQQMQGCPVVAQDNNARIVKCDLDNRPNCPNESRPISMVMSNFGAQPLTSCTIETYYNSYLVGSIPWSGDLQTYQLDTMELADVIFDGDTSLVEVRIIQPNGQSEQDVSDNSVEITSYPSKVYASDSIRVEIQTDGYGHQIYWEIRNELDTIIDKGGNNWVAYFDGWGDPVDLFSSYADNSFYAKNISLEGHNFECLTIRVLSGMGYGTCCTYGEGFIRFKKGDEVIYEFKDFGRRAYGKLFVAENPPALLSTYTVNHETESQANGSINIIADGGIPPLKYNIGCGEEHDIWSEFTGLSAGWYCISTRDAIGQTATDSVEVQNIVGTEQPVLSGLRLLPNPVDDVLQVQFRAEQSGQVSASVVNSIGQQVWEATQMATLGQQTLIVPTDNLPEGIYLLVLRHGEQSRAERFVVSR